MFPSNLVAKCDHVDQIDSRVQELEIAVGEGKRWTS